MKKKIFLGLIVAVVLTAMSYITLIALNFNEKTFINYVILTVIVCEVQFFLDYSKPIANKRNVLKSSLISFIISSAIILLLYSIAIISNISKYEDVYLYIIIVFGYMSLFNYIGYGLENSDKTLYEKIFFHKK